MNKLTTVYVVMQSVWDENRMPVSPFMLEAFLDKDAARAIVDKHNNDPGMTLHYSVSEVPLSPNDWVDAHTTPTDPE